MSHQNNNKYDKKMADHRIRWGDLISPRAMYTFTLGDAWSAIPTLLAMGGFFVLAIVLIVAFKKICNWLIDYSVAKQKYVLVKVDNGVRKWKEASHSSVRSMLHVLLETIVFGLIVTAAFFAASIGNTNIWDSPIALSVIGMIVTYVFGSGLQQIGSGYFVYAFNGMVVGEYWETAGAHDLGGVVHRITIFYVEFARFDIEHQCACFLRIPMSTILNGSYERNMAKEMTAVEVTVDSINNRLSRKDGVVKDVIIKTNKLHAV